MKHIESYIDSSIETPKNLPSNIVFVLNKLSEYDKRTDGSVLYFDKLDDLCVLVKNAIAAKAMSKKDWSIIIEKYWTHADKIFDKESKSENL